MRTLSFLLDTDCHDDLPCPRQKPLRLITKAEAEAVVGAMLNGPQLGAQGMLCKFSEPGYGELESRNKLVSMCQR
jgi:hypothetical protein